MKYILLVKTATGDDELLANEGWKVAGVTPYSERSIEWEEMCEEQVAQGDIEAFHVAEIES